MSIIGERKPSSHFSPIKLKLLVCLIVSLSGLTALNLVIPCTAYGLEGEVAADEATENDTELVETKGCIPCTSWVSPDLVPWATVLCIHGFTMDKNVYNDFGKRLSAVGIPCYAIDVRGFGSWQKAKGHTKLNFTQALNDVHEAIRAVRKAHPFLPLILVGESMGGSLALQAAAQDEHSLDGLICSVPAEERYGAKQTNRKIAFSALKKGFNRPTNVGTRIVKQITGNEELRAELEADPDARMDYSPKEMLQFKRFMGKTDKRAAEIKNVPVLFLQGGSDRLVKVSGTAKAYEKIGSSDKDFVLVGESEHLVLEAGQCTDHTIDVVTSWILQHAHPKFAEKVQKLVALAGTNTKAAQGHLKIAQGMIDLEDPEGARLHFKEAIELGRGTPIAMIASQLSAALPKSPEELQFEKQSADSKATFVSHAEAMANDKPTVIFFGARWIDPSYELNNAMQRALKIYGDHVNFVRLDADLPENDSLVKAYDVTLIPTVLILNWKNNVVSTKYGPLSDRVLAGLIDRGLFDSKFASKTGVAEVAGMPQAVKSKPSVVFFGSFSEAQCQKVWNSLLELGKTYGEQFNLVRIDSDEPKNASLVEQYQKSSLPAVLFLNSANDQVSYTTGDVDQERLQIELSKLLSAKKLPELSKEI